MTQQLARYTPVDETGMDLERLGQMLAKSGYFQDTKDAAQAIVKVLAGRELGIGPVAAMTGIYLVKGRVTMSANLIAAQIKRSGRYNYTVTTMTDEKVEISLQELRSGQWVEIGRSSFTKADAVQAGLWGSSEPWKKTPRNMLFARAISNAAKWYTPDIFSGPVYTPDELNGSAPAAYVVDTTTGEVIDTPATEPVKPSRREKLLARIHELTAEAADAELEITLAKPLEEMSDDELVQHGQNLRAALKQANVPVE